MVQKRPEMKHSRMDVKQRRPAEEDRILQESERYPSHRRKGGRHTPAVFAVSLILVLAIGMLAGGWLYERFAPSKEQKDLNEWFEVNGDEVRLFLNDKRQTDALGIAQDGETYLPVSYVNSQLNKRFFWNENEKLLVYTLPDETLQFKPEDVDEKGNPYYLIRDDGMYLSLSLILAHTDMRASCFVNAEEPAKRAFLYKDQGTVTTALVKKNTKLRTKGGIKSPVLVDLQKGEELTILESMEKWDKVSAPSGFTGYVQHKRLDTPKERTFATGFKEPQVKHNLLPEKVVMAWHLMLNQKANSSFSDYLANTGGVMNVVCPTWVQINGADGGYDNYASKSYVDEAHAAGVKVWATVDNFNNPKAVSDFSTRDYFADSKNRADFINRLMEDAAAFGYDGYNLDFEGLPTDAGASYAQFYRELSVACRKASLVLSIDNYVPHDFNNHYDISEQGVFADYVVIMGYDEHTNGSEEAGSVASLSYTEYGIDETLKQVPAEQVIHAIPFFTRIWVKETGKKLRSDAMGIKQAAAYIEENGIQLTWDAESGQYYGEKTFDGGKRMVWMEEKRSIGEKIKLIQEKKLGGVGAWRLGFEPADVWTELNLNKT